MDHTQVSTSLEKACTIFSISYGDAVLFGSNLDHPNIRSYIWFRSPSTEEYGGVLLGYYAKAGGRTWVGYEGGMNDHGLAFDTNGLPDVPMDPHPEKPFSWATGNFWHKILRECSNVSETISLAKNFNFEDKMNFQVHAVDTTGEAVVISPGADGELSFTRKDKGDGYLVSTNFNPADPEIRHEPYPCWRYETAVEMLEKIGHEEDLTVESSRTILDAVHFEGGSYNTIFSYICDLKKGIVSLYYFHQFEEVVELNLVEELAKGERTIEIRDLFSQETRDYATEEYKSYQTRGFRFKCPICGQEGHFTTNVKAREEAFKHLITVHGMEVSQALEIVNNLELKIDSSVSTCA